MMFTNFDFQYPWFLLLLMPLCILLIWAWMRPQPTVRIPGRLLFTNANSGKSGKRNKAELIPFGLYTLAGILIVTALAGPRFGIGEIVQHSKGVDILIAIDLSGSMQAYDAPKSIQTEEQLYRGIQNGNIKQRIDVCKTEVKRFIDMRPNDRIGLIAFAPQAYAVCPPTIDHAWLSQQVDNLKLHLIGDGTGIAAPIASAVERLKDSDARRKVMVLFTDGENTVANKLTPLQAADIAQSYHITIHTVGIGSKRAVVEQIQWGRKRLMQYDAQFNDTLLRKIAEVTEGKYYAAEDADGMRKALEEIDKMETKSQELPTIILHSEEAPNVALAALLCALAAFSLSHTLLLKYP